MKFEGIETIPQTNLKVRFGFVGREPGILGPGRTTSDPDYQAKIRSILALTDPGVILHPRSDNCGTISYYQKQFPFRQLKRHSVITSDGDGAVLPHAFSEKTSNFLAVRIRDCVPIVGGEKSGTLFVGHLSNQDLFGFGNHSTFRGSILKQLFQLIVPFRCKIVIGPSIGGNKNPNGDDNQCKCYGYTEKPKQTDASTLRGLIRNEYPNFEVDHLIVPGLTGDKQAFLWGQLIRELLIHHGVEPENINSEYNVCTLCNPTDWYSDRDMNTKPEAYETKIGASNLAWIAPHFE